MSMYLGDHGGGNRVLTQQNNRMLPATFDERNNYHKAPVDNSATESDTAFMSDECDEKRSYTPQPRQISMLGGLKTQASKLNRAPPS